MRKKPMNRIFIILNETGKGVGAFILSCQNFAFFVLVAHCLCSPSILVRCMQKLVPGNKKYGHIGHEKSI